MAHGIAGRDHRSTLAMQPLGEKGCTHPASVEVEHGLIDIDVLLPQKVTTQWALSQKN